MSKVKVTFYGLIKTDVDKQEEEYNISGNITVKQFLQSLALKYGDGFGDKLFTSEIQLLPLVVIQVDGRDIDELDGLNTKLKGISKLSITVMPHPVLGG